jgi:Fe-S cluster biogenesis protein NfuA
MHVIVESTPNPRTLKFLPGARISTAPRKWERTDDLDTALVKALFAIGGVCSVLANEDAISVTVDDAGLWDAVEPSVSLSIATHIREFVTHDFTPMPEPADDFDEVDAEVVEKILELINTNIRPAVARDGGDIVFRSFRSGVLTLDMRGACSGCPSSSATLKNGIQNLMFHFVPEVREVVASEG